LDKVRLDVDFGMPFPVNKKKAKNCMDLKNKVLPTIDFENDIT